MGSLWGGDIILHFASIPKFNFLWVSQCWCLSCCVVSASLHYSITRQSIHAIKRPLRLICLVQFRSVHYLLLDLKTSVIKVLSSNCVGVINGYLLVIANPRKSQEKSVQSYFSGHEQTMTSHPGMLWCQLLHHIPWVGGLGVSKDNNGITERDL